MQVLDVVQGSYEWHCARQGKVTGTTLASALGTPKVQDTLRYRLVSQRMTEPQIGDINSAAVTRGNELEPLARKAATGYSGEDYQETGMLLSDEIPMFGLSPDAVVYSGKNIIGGLEIKCPDSKKHVEYLMVSALPKEYAVQVKAPFIMSPHIEWWDFVSFDDRNYECPIFYTRINRSHFEPLDKDREKLAAFLESVDEAHSALTF